MCFVNCCFENQNCANPVPRDNKFFLSEFDVCYRHS
uniref:Uncharacterized protein n=1 Tax=Lactiplantibacillus paraplantarum TaxID=60520 RepID=Q8RTK5_9LACO|nr:unknown [Lactiplantibacillus paraplantarum]